LSRPVNDEKRIVVHNHRLDHLKKIWRNQFRERVRGFWQLDFSLRVLPYNGLFGHFMLSPFFPHGSWPWDQDENNLHS
jgi:hypothetical protein